MYGDTQGATQRSFTFATATYVVGLFVFGHAYEAGIPLMHSGRAFGRRYYAYQYLVNLSCKLIQLTIATTGVLVFDHLAYTRTFSRLFDALNSIFPLDFRRHSTTSLHSELRFLTVLPNSHSHPSSLVKSPPSLIASSLMFKMLMEGRSGVEGVLRERMRVGPAKALLSPIDWVRK